MFDFSPEFAPTPLMQSAGFEAALRTCGQAPLRLDCGTLMLRRRVCGVPIAMLPRARIDDAAATLALAREVTCGPLILSPDAPMDLSVHGALPLISPAHQAVVRLHHDRDALRKALHGKWRNRLKHGEKSGLRVVYRALPASADHWLLRADARQQRTRGYRTWPVPLTRAFAATAPCAAMLFEAFLGKAPVAAILILRHGDTATYHVGHTTDTGRAASAHTLLMWTAMRWCAEQGHRWLDLGLLDTVSNPGLARFKLGTGADVMPLGGTWLHWEPLAPLRGLARLDRTAMALGP
ncbi:GNAT family N-acetyltransferase [Pseudosulfitobacter koreensis]|uniref:GNAT family N-acetyltransferase n=1 Tax=Pseudosulfitobacter koreensis TaxID=2968472 RepID=A0ABT1YXD3_9RHOB|nr:GNAT family N-acetyltransferase [Pseudosulfitobacter koreense]MCR8825517.1 GNAT family N-acetyltransferase [Pseudosulfitobacter koreense]